MIFKKLIITQGMYYREINFSDTNNLIYSLKNSTGKTTLLRLLLYSMGYRIPSTKNIEFDDCETNLSLFINNQTYKIIRYRSNIDIIENETTENYYLPCDETAVHAKLFGTNNKDILNNVLGAFYLDQDKGWTLLNRGVVIGKIKFNIESLIRGIDDIDCESLINKKKAVENQLIKYKQLLDIAKYKEKLSIEENNIIHDKEYEETDIKLEILYSKLESLNDKMKNIDKVIADNKKFREYIENMKLKVKSPSGEIIPVNEKTIYGFDFSVEYLLTKKRLLSTETSVLKNDIKNIEDSREKQVDIGKTENIIDNFDKKISRIKIDPVAVKSIISDMQKEKKRLNKLIKEKTLSNSSSISNMYETIKKYGEELGVLNYMNSKSNFLFTNDLKSLSGTILHKIVFAFKLSYIIEIQNKIGIKLPIILDSPSGREVTEENIEAMINIINRDFSDNQIIIASIHKYDLQDVNVIELKDRLMNEIDISYKK